MTRLPVVSGKAILLYLTHVEQLILSGRLSSHFHDCESIRGDWAVPSHDRPGREWSKKRSTAQRACVVATMVLSVCTAVGGFLFQFLGITLPALKIAGGVLLFLVAVDMLNARESRSKQTEEEREEGALKEDIAIFPLGIPLLSGPGSMITVFILVDRAKTVVEHSVIYISIVVTMLISYLALTQASRFAHYLGATGINVMSRIMGLILAAIAAQFILNGVTEALPGLTH